MEDLVLMVILVIQMMTIMEKGETVETVGTVINKIHTTRVRRLHTMAARGEYMGCRQTMTPSQEENGGLNTMARKKMGIMVGRTVLYLSKMEQVVI
jgi:hypothetical protein